MTKSSNGIIKRGKIPVNQKLLKPFVILICLCVAIPPFSLASAESRNEELNEDEEIAIDDELSEDEEIELDEGLYDGDEVVLDEFIDPIVLYYEDFESEEELDAKVTELLNDESVSGVQVISKAEDSMIGPRAVRLPGKWYTHGAGRIKYYKLSDSYGPIINSVASDPGVTMKLSYNKKHSATYSGDFGLNSTIVSLTVGFNVTSSYSVSYSGSYKVPTNANNRTVKRATVSSKLIYQRRSYTVVSPKYPKGKTGTAKKPIGIYYQKKLTYK